MNVVEIIKDSTTVRYLPEIFYFSAPICYGVMYPPVESSVAATSS
jgi:hypothetical protein